jgi:hypothetical protein
MSRWSTEAATWRRIEASGWNMRETWNLELTGLKLDVKNGDAIAKTDVQ